MWKHDFFVVVQAKTNFSYIYVSLPTYMYTLFINTKNKSAIYAKVKKNHCQSPDVD